VNSIRRWWLNLGRVRYLLITVTPTPAKACEGRGGGSNGSRVRLWKRELQKLANKLGLDIVVSHLPPGTSKWEQNRAPPVLLHQPELACSAPQQLSDDCRADLGRDHQNQPHRAL
jgi:hypothetical protein